MGHTLTKLIASVKTDNWWQINTQMSSTFSTSSDVYI